MKRRNFIKLSATASAAALIPMELQAIQNQLSSAGCDFSNRKIVIVTLGGGNDGLNTLVPLNHYDTYSNLRPNIKIPETGPNSYITLDAQLPDNQLLGLHPALTKFKSMYDDGLLRILQSVGYPSPTRSHFSGFNYFNSGTDGHNPPLAGTKSGWMGRFMEEYYSQEFTGEFPLAMEVSGGAGSGANPASFLYRGDHEFHMAINISTEGLPTFRTTLEEEVIGQHNTTNIPQSHHGEALNYLNLAEQSILDYAGAIQTAYNIGISTAPYEDTAISNSLKTVAKLIAGGSKTKIFQVGQGGYDTHGYQVEAAGQVAGSHSKILGELADGVDSFINDLKANTVGEDVVVITFSEFGRKIIENGSLGTDHGDVAPVFIFGETVEGGISGTNVDLTEAGLGNTVYISDMQYDYRQIYGTLLQNFLGASTSTIDKTFFDHNNNLSFTESKVPEITKEILRVPEPCYQDAVSTVELNTQNLQIYPNPFTSHVNVKLSGSLGSNARELSYEIFTIAGAKVASGKESLTNGSIRIDVPTNLSNGNYLLHTKIGGKSDVYKIVKIADF